MDRERPTPLRATRILALVSLIAMAVGVVIWYVIDDSAPALLGRAVQTLGVVATFFAPFEAMRRGRAVTHGSGDSETSRLAAVQRLTEDSSQRPSRPAVRFIRHPIRLQWTRVGEDLPAARLDDVLQPQLQESGGEWPAGGADRISKDGLIDGLWPLYRSLPSQKLVVVGGPGSGKTATLHRMFSEAMREFRASVSRQVGDIPPAPLFVSLTGWDAKQDIAEWIGRIVNRDHPEISQGLATELVRRGKVRLFLDGIDEMHHTLRISAIRKIDSALWENGYLVTSRVDEYVQAVKQSGIFSDALVLRLKDVRPDQAAAYLLRGQSAQDHRWDTVAEAVAKGSAGAVGEAFVTPLALSIAKDVYGARSGGDDPAELLDSSVFPTAKAVNKHLFTKLLTNAFPGPRERALLGWLALHCEESRSTEIEWWNLRRTFWWASGLLALALLLGAVGGLGALVATGSLAESLCVGLPVALSAAVVGPILYSRLVLRGIYPGGWRARVTIICCSTVFFAIPVILKGFVVQQSIEEVCKRLVPFSLLVGAACGIGAALLAARDSPLRLRRITPRARDLFGLSAAAVILSIALGLRYGSATGALVIPFFISHVVLVVTLTQPLDLFEESENHVRRDTVSPASTWYDDAIGAVVLSLLIGTLGGLYGWLILRNVVPETTAIMAALVAVIGALPIGLLALGQCGALLVWSLTLRLRMGTAPWVMRTLQTGVDRSIIRTVGPTYQFRHKNLQDFLVDQYAVRFGVRTKLEPKPNSRGQCRDHHNLRV